MSLYLLSDTTFTIDIPGPNKLEFSSVTARSRMRKAAKNPIPITTGLVFAGIPYVIGAALVYFGPAPMKPVGATMLVPGPTDPVLFGIGYKFGESIESDIEKGVRDRLNLQIPRGFEFDYRHLFM